MSRSNLGLLFLLCVSVIFTNTRYSSVLSDCKSLVYWMVNTSRISLVDSISKVMQVVPIIRCKVF
jgi:hypothetical protein